MKLIFNGSGCRVFSIEAESLNDLLITDCEAKDLRTLVGHLQRDGVDMRNVNVSYGCVSLQTESNK